MTIYDENEIVMAVPCDCKKEVTIKSIRESLEKAYQEIIGLKDE